MKTQRNATQLFLRVRLPHSRHATDIGPWQISRALTEAGATALGHHLTALIRDFPEGTDITLITRAPKKEHPKPKTTEFGDLI